VFYLGIHADMVGISAEIMPALLVVPAVFSNFGLDCWLTSAVRPKDGKSLHGWGMAMDFDASAAIPQKMGDEIAREVGNALGANYYCLWHDGHLHIEHDPNNRGVSRFD
jgi:hypothetical protein